MSLKGHDRMSFLKNQPRFYFGRRGGPPRLASCLRLISVRRHASYLCLPPDIDLCLPPEEHRVLSGGHGRPLPVGRHRRLLRRVHGGLRDRVRI